jgi:hypothetical protein
MYNDCTVFEIYSNGDDIFEKLTKNIEKDTVFISNGISKVYKNSEIDLVLKEDEIEKIVLKKMAKFIKNDKSYTLKKVLKKIDSENKIKVFNNLVNSDLV